MIEKYHEHPLNHIGQLSFLLLFIIVWVSDSFILYKSTFIAFYIPVWIRFGVLIFIILLVIYLFRAVIFAFSNEDYSKQIISSGPFRYIRHPMYLTCILFYFSLWFSTISLYSLLVLIVIVLFYNYISNYEEQFLLNKYGKSYSDYIKKTGRWIPKKKINTT